jgi:hypothetical protein
MLSDSIHDLLYCPSSGTELDNVHWFLEDLEHYSKEPFDYEPKHLEVLRRLAKAYLKKPSFVSFQNLHRSAVAMMQGQDYSPGMPGILTVIDGEISFLPYGQLKSWEPIEASPPEPVRFT